jgi:prepilin-type N-terminal cleavage/methylation domain-containing protein
MFHVRRRLTSQSGFTIVELLVVIAIVTLLFVLSTLNLGHSESDTSVTSTVDTMLADIKSQQLLSMAGDAGSQTTQQPHGIYLQSTSYTLFAGSTYSASDANNYTVSIAPNKIITTFPSSTLSFEFGDGAIPSYSASTDTITVTGVGKTQTITLDRFGATSVL